MLKILMFTIGIGFGAVAHGQVAPSDCLAEMLQGKKPTLSKYSACKAQCKFLESEATQREFSASEKHEVQFCFGLDGLMAALKRGDYADRCTWLSDIASAVELSPDEKQEFQRCIGKTFSR